MERVLEPELMDGKEQAEAYAGSDFEQSHGYIISKLKMVFPNDNKEGFVLDLGCGAADPAIRIAKSYSNMNIHGVDGSYEMLRLAHGYVANAGLEERINLQLGIIPDVDLPKNPYDLIFSNSFLHHLHDPNVLWDTVKKYGNDSTFVFMSDLIRPSNVDEAESKIDKYLGDQPKILQRDFYNSLLAAFEIDEVKDQLARKGLDNLNVDQISDEQFAVYGSLGTNQ